MAQIIDYTNLIPPPPEGLKKFAEDVELGKYNRIIFSHDWDTDLTGKKNRVAHCVCTSCQSEWYSPWLKEERQPGTRYAYSVYGIKDVVYGEKIWEGHDTLCPYCGEAGRLILKSKVEQHQDWYRNYITVAVFGRIDDKFTITEWKVIKNFHSNGAYSYEIKRWQRYVFEKKKVVVLNGYRRYFANIIYNGKWQQLKRGTLDYAPDYIFPYDENFTEGTTMENSRLKEYLTAGGEGYKRLNPALYLRTYQRHPNIETLMQIGLAKTVADGIAEMSPARYKNSDLERLIDWKQRSPYKMIGRDREIVRMARVKNWDIAEIQLMQAAKNKGIQLTAENIRQIKSAQRSSVFEIFEKETNPLKVIKYLNKKGRAYSFFEDYHRMAGLLGYDLNNPVIRYPQNLQVAHDNVQAAVKYNKNKLLDGRFSELKQRLSALDYTKDGICITIAGSSGQLIEEGKALKHCVGGYAETHCKGRSIFFIRQRQYPWMPWYTLQVELLTGRQLQLHGYHNELDGQKIPKEVTGFINHWLKKVFCRFDVKTMEFVGRKPVLQSAAN